MNKLIKNVQGLLNDAHVLLEADIDNPDLFQVETLVGEAARKLQVLTRWRAQSEKMSAEFFGDTPTV